MNVNIRVNSDSDEVSFQAASEGMFILELLLVLCTRNARSIGRDFDIPSEKVVELSDKIGLIRAINDILEILLDKGDNSSRR